MGLYDSIMVPCPKCGYRNEFQTKSGPCELNTYQIEDAPDDAMANVNRHAPIKCHVCDTMYSAPERPTQLDILSANPTACREDIARYRALVEQLTKERDEARTETDRLTTCLSMANANHENFERLWYMTQDETDALKSKLADVERERDLLRSDGKKLVHDFEEISRTLNDIGWPSSNVGIRTRAIDALKTLARTRNSALSELAQVKARLAKVEKENERLLKYVEHNDEEYRTMKDVLRAEHEACKRMRPVYEASVQFRETCKSFGEGPITYADYYDAIHAVNAAVDHALSTSQPAKETK